MIIMNNIENGIKNLLKEIKKSSTIINEKDLNTIFDNAWLNMEKSFYKLETRQFYLCDMNKNYKDYIKGNKESLIKELKEFNNGWPTMLNEKHEIDLKRLHLINLPLSEYLNYEMYFYLINEKHGEKIKCLETKGIELDDFIIFDNKEILISSYNHNNKLQANYYSDNKLLIKKVVLEYDKLYKKAKNYKKYASFDKQLLNKIKL